MVVSQALSSFLLHPWIYALVWMGCPRFLVDWNNEIPETLLQTICLVPYNLWNVHSSCNSGLLHQGNRYAILDCEFSLACLHRTCYNSSCHLFTNRGIYGILLSTQIQVEHRLLYEAQSIPLVFRVLHDPALSSGNIFGNQNVYSCWH